MNYAQPKPFDSFWPLQLQSALRLLRTAADTWSIRGIDALDIKQVLTVLVLELSAPWGLPPLPLAARLRTIDALDVEIMQRATRRDEKSVALAQQDLCDLMQLAVEDWCIHGSESPPTDQVLLELIDILFHYGLVRRPPPASL